MVEEKINILEPLDTQNGFTLIELMIVIAILAMLAAIALPQYSSYRTRSYNAAAQADLRNAAHAQEIYYTMHQTYCANTSTLTGVTYMLLLSDGVIFQIDPLATNTQGYVMRTRHTLGDATFVISGPGGVIQKE